MAGILMPLTLAAAGCSGSKPAVSAPRATVTQTVTTSSSDSPSDAIDPTASDSVDPSSDLSTDPLSESPSGPAVLPPGREGSTLTLADFFDPGSSWTEGSYDVASRKAVQGIYSPVSYCGSSNPRELELRLGDNYKTLSFSVGQTNDSDRSDEILTVAVKANGRQIIVKNLPFNTIQVFSVPVTMVNSLQVDFYISGDICVGSIDALLFKPVLS
jgi:hypothetical protein